MLKSVQINGRPQPFHENSEKPPTSFAPPKIYVPPYFDDLWMNPSSDIVKNIFNYRSIHKDMYVDGISCTHVRTSVHADRNKCFTNSRLHSFHCSWSASAHDKLNERLMNRRILCLI